MSILGPVQHTTTGIDSYMLMNLVEAGVLGKLRQPCPHR